MSIFQGAGWGTGAPAMGGPLPAGLGAPQQMDPSGLPSGDAQSAPSSSQNWFSSWFGGGEDKAKVCLIDYAAHVRHVAALALAVAFLGIITFAAIAILSTHTAEVCMSCIGLSFLCTVVVQEDLQPTDLNTDKFSAPPLPESLQADSQLR